MNVTRDIVKDLLPLYVTGEASPDTRALVESYLGEDQELRCLADALRDGDLPSLKEATMPLGAGRAALETTKGLLRRRTWLLALAWFFSGLPLACAFDASGLRFLLLRDAPIAGSASLAVAVALWLAYGVTVRRMRVSGL